MRGKRSVRAKFEDVRLLNGVAVFMTSRNRRTVKIVEKLRMMGYSSTHILRSVGIKHGRSPIAMSITDAKHFFDFFELDYKMTRPDFEKLENFYRSINPEVVISSIYDDKRNTKSSRIRAYIFWLRDILYPHIHLKADTGKSIIFLNGLEKYVNPKHIKRPYSFIVETYPKHLPPKVFHFQNTTVEGGKLIRIHTGLSKKFGEEFGFFECVDELDELTPIERDSYLTLAKVVS